MGVERRERRKEDMTKSGIAVGKNAGHITAERTLAKRPSTRKGRASKHMTFVRSVVRDSLGFAGYEKRCMELLKVGKEKRALRVLKNRVGTLSRAKARREALSELLRQQRLK